MGMQTPFMVLLERSPLTEQCTVHSLVLYISCVLCCICTRECTVHCSVNGDLSKNRTMKGVCIPVIQALILGVYVLPHQCYRLRFTGHELRLCWA